MVKIDESTRIAISISLVLIVIFILPQVVEPGEKLSPKAVGIILAAISFFCFDLAIQAIRTGEFKDGLIQSWYRSALPLYFWEHTIFSIAFAIACAVASAYLIFFM